MKIETENVEHLTTSAAGIAELLGLKIRRIGQLVTELKLTRIDGQFPIAATVRSYIENLRERSDLSELQAARKRKIEADAARSELALAQRRGEILELKAVEAVWSARKIAARNVLLRSPEIPEKLKNQVLREMEIASPENYLL